MGDSGADRSGREALAEETRPTSEATQPLTPAGVIVRTLGTKQEVNAVLRTLWRGWLVVARTIGYFQSQLILALVYFVVVTPFALAVRIFKDPLNLRGVASWHWFSLDDRPTPTLDWVKREF